jgi:hypothetical protein
MAEGKVHGWSMRGGEVSTALDSFQYQGDNLFKDNTRDCRGRSRGGDGKTMDAERVGAERLFKAIHFLGQLVDGGVLLVDLLTEGSVLEHEFPNRLLQNVNLGELATKRVQLLVQSRKRVLHGGGVGRNGMGRGGRLVVLSLIWHWQERR